MKDKRSKLMMMDDTLRLMFAFYSCVSNNPNWILESENSKHNRELARKILKLEDFADDYFLSHDRFYAFTAEKQEDDVIACKMEEYDSYYDLADSHLEMEFSYHIPSKNIIRLGEVQRIKKEEEKQKKKVA